MPDVFSIVMMALLAVLLLLAIFLAMRLSRLARENSDVRTQLVALLTQSGQSERDLRQDLATQRSELSAQLHQQAQTAQSYQQAQTAQQLQQWERFEKQAAQLTNNTEQKLEHMRKGLEERLDVLRTDNAQKLEQMRATVDEKLQTTLETRLGESFKQVADRLEQVHKGLGEMQTLAVGVGDLKRVLSNVKTRGNWGEIQLAALLAEILTPQQYETNIETRSGSGQRVEFAIRLPGRNEEQACWLPIDAKFPLDDWQRLQTALEAADVKGAEEARQALTRFVIQQAKTIQEKYVHIPFTTEFAILFVPVESLYAELMARPGLSERVQREHRVMLAGPSNLAALLNSLQLGFRTLAIEKRSNEVWLVLGAVKNEFQKFGGILEKTRIKLDQAAQTIKDADVRTRAITRKLREVESLPEQNSGAILGIPDLVEDDDHDATP
jgi:Uncharacterized protein conserved in bacteria